MRRGTHAGGTYQGGAGLSLYSPDALAAFHRATLEVLERTGLFVEDDDALDVFADGGCRVARERHIVKIPPEVVEESIRRTPPVYRMGARDPKNDLRLGGDAVHFSTFMVGVSVNDLESGEQRPSTVNDVREMAVLADALENIDLFNVPVTAFDAPQQATESLHSYAAALDHTSKPVFPGSVCTYLAAQGALEMAAVVCGGMDAVRERHFLDLGGGTTSPLQLGSEATKMMLLAARHGLNVAFGTMAMAGGTAPASDAAGLVMQLAEMLGCVVLAQLAERGTSCLLATSGTFMDMRFATCPVGSPEAAFSNVGFAQMAHHYGMASYCGGL
jgi:trimethylamine---corrinoid protein Co-methyltransferase